MKKEANLKLDTQSKLDKIMKFMNMDNISNYLDKFPRFDSIKSLPIYSFGESDINFREYVEGLEKTLKNIKITIYKDKDKELNQDNNEKNKVIIKSKLYFVFEIVPNKERIICVCDLDNWKGNLEYWNSNKYPYTKWTDVKEDENKFIRNVENVEYHVEDGKIAYCNIKYNFSDMMFKYQDKNKNSKIGAIDLETYGSKEFGLGNLSVYAGGIALNDGYKALYYIDPERGEGITPIKEKNEDLLYKMFKDLFNYIDEDRKNRNRFTLYAHNLGRFDN